MREETIQQLLSDIEASFVSVGAQDFDDGMCIATKVYDCFLGLIRLIDTRAKATEAMREWQATPEEEAQVIAVAQNLPTLLMVGMQFAATQMAKELPTALTGRRPALTAAKRQAVCDSIAELVRKGASISTAQCRTANKFNVSRGTVKRAWSKRSETPIPSVHELIAALKSSFIGSSTLGGTDVIR